MNKKSPRWNIGVFFESKNKRYHCYAIHTNGKVEKAGWNINLTNAVLLASDLVQALNRDHRYAGKYEGKDEIVGTKVSNSKINKIIKEQDEATKKFLASHKKIFGTV